MSHIHFSFETDAFVDSAESIARNINEIPGEALANWLADALRSSGFDVSEVWDEDHGWDFSLTHDGSNYLCACSIAADETSREGHVVLGKDRSLMDQIRGRNKLQMEDAVATAIAATLEESADVRNLESDVS